MSSFPSVKLDVVTQNASVIVEVHKVVATIKVLLSEFEAVHVTMERQAAIASAATTFLYNVDLILVLPVVQDK